MRIQCADDPHSKLIVSSLRGIKEGQVPTASPGRGFNAHVNAALGAIVSY